MAETQTPNFGFTKYDRGDRFWDVKLNQNWDDLDAILKTIEESIVVPAVGQVRREVSNRVQDVTTTPVLIYAFDSIDHEFNNTVTLAANPGAGDGSTVRFTTQANYEGYYTVSFSFTCDCGSNVVLNIVPYVNGLPSGLSVELDFSEKNTASGSVSLNGISQGSLSAGDYVEFYIISSGNAQITWLSAIGFVTRRYAPPS